MKIGPLAKDVKSRPCADHVLAKATSERPEISIPIDIGGGEESTIVSPRRRTMRV